VAPNATTPEQFYLNKNPGDYEVRVLRGGKLTRTLKFSVGADGKIVDPGFSAQNQTGDGRILLPVQVLGDTDGKRARARRAVTQGHALSASGAPFSCRRPESKNRQPENHGDWKQSVTEVPRRRVQRERKQFDHD